MHTGKRRNPEIRSQSEVGELEPWKTKEVYWPSNHAYLDTPRYRDANVGVGSTIEGPAIVGMEHTTIGIPPESTCEVDSMSNYIINFGGK